MHVLLNKKQTIDLIVKKGIENIRLEQWYGAKSNQRFYLVEIQKEGQRKLTTIARVNRNIKKWFDAVDADDMEKYGAINVSYFKLVEKVNACV